MQDDASKTASMTSDEREEQRGETEGRTRNDGAGRKGGRVITSSKQRPVVVFASNHHT